MTKEVIDSPTDKKARVCLSAIRPSEIMETVSIKLEEIEAKYDVDNCNFLALKPITLDRYFKNIIFL